MKRFLSKYFPILPVLLIFVPLLTTHSCANTTAAPTGGDKDTIPPYMYSVMPETNVRRVPLTGARFVFSFDEFVTIKNARNITLSPPVKNGSVKAKLRGRSVVVTVEDTLRPNTTYTLEFTDAIADNNEGNMFPGYTYVFSTGDRIDTMMVTGVVRDCSTLQSVKGAKVLLYSDLSDSAVFKSPADAVALTDDWGFFCMRNIPDTVYRMYAVMDDNSNNLYDPGTESIAFVSGNVRPVTVVNDSLPEVMKFEMTDTVSCRMRKEEFELRLFKEANATQYIKNHGRTADRACFVSFMAPKAHIDTMWISGVPADRLITQFNPQRDSLEIWVNDRRAMPDTFHLKVNYLKTDSLGVLLPFTEELRLVNPVPARVARRNRGNIKHEDTICVVKTDVAGDMVEENGVTVEFKYPLINADFDSVRFHSINPRQVEEECKFSVLRDSLNLRVYHIYPEVAFRPGYDYRVKFPEGVFRDINGFRSDSSEVKFRLPDDVKLSSLTLRLSGVKGAKYIVDLLNEQKSNVLRQYVIESDSTVTFKYLKAGKYCLRMTEDVNRNGLVDTGDLLSQRQPESVLFYKIDGENEYIEILESTDIDQAIDIERLFGHTKTDVVSDEK